MKKRDMHQNFFEFTLPKYSDPRGDLLSAEFDDTFPLKEVKRIYFLQNTPENTMRGAHCHFEEEEVFVCISGSCTALIDTNGAGKKEILLDSSQKAIYVGTQVWHEFTDFSTDATLLCFSSTHYMPGEGNYEYSYENFLGLKK